MHRYFIDLSYNGAAYHGWQVQPNGVSVQGAMELALYTLLRRQTPVTGAGRTDAGVHALLMTAHFDSDDALDTCWLTEKLNRLLPPDIAVSRIREVRADAHARFDATYRTYIYNLAFTKDPFNSDRSWRMYRPLDIDLMNKAASLLLGCQDFTSFSKLHTDVKTNRCNVTEALWRKRSDAEWTFTITADRFLRNMVRAIVGTLVTVGRGRLTIDGFREIIEAKDRCRAGTSAPAHALFLVDIGYPEDVYDLSARVAEV